MVRFLQSRGMRFVRCEGFSDYYEGMEGIRSATEQAQGVIRNLGQRVESIGTILGVIDDVADETAGSLEQMAASIGQVDQNAAGTASLSARMIDAAERGRERGSQQDRAGRQWLHELLHFEVLFPWSGDSIVALLRRVGKPSRHRACSSRSPKGAPCKPYPRPSRSLTLSTGSHTWRPCPSRS